MDTIAHDAPRNRRHPHHPFAPPLLRNFVLITGTVLALSLAFLSAALPGNPPKASAQAAPTTYDLCERSPAVRAGIINHLKTIDDTGNNSVTKTHPLTGASISVTVPLGAYDDFGCAAGESAVISAADLESHTHFIEGNFPTAGVATTKALLLWRAAELQENDLDGIWLETLQLTRSTVETVPSRWFEDAKGGFKFLYIERGSNLKLLPHDLFEGALIHRDGLRFQVQGTPSDPMTNFTHFSMPYNLFDPVGDMLRQWWVADTNVVHLNLRWFRNASYLGIRGNGPDPDGSGPGTAANWGAGDMDLRGIVDSWFYAENDGNIMRYTDATMATQGDTITSASTTHAQMIAAVNGAIDRGSITASVRSPHPWAAAATDFTNVDLCNPGYRSPRARDRIITNLKAMQAAADATAAGGGNNEFVKSNAHYSAASETVTLAAGTYGTTFGCGSGQTAVVSKTDLRNHTFFDDSDSVATNRFNMDSLPWWPNPATGEPLKVLSTDLRHIDARTVSFWRGRMGEIPEGLFQGLTLKNVTLTTNNLRELPHNLFRGMDTTNVYNHSSGWSALSLNDNLLSDHGMRGNLFNEFSALNRIYLGDNMLGRINEQWFSAMANLRTIHLNGNFIRRVYNSGTTYDAESPTGWEFNIYVPPPAQGQPNAGLNNLRNHLNARIPGTLDGGVTGFRPPDVPGINPCEDASDLSINASSAWQVESATKRHDAVWKELNLQFGFPIGPDHDNRREIPAGRPPRDEYDSAIGLIRNDRHARMDLSDCQILPGIWVDPDTGVPLSPQPAIETATSTTSGGPPEAANAELAIDLGNPIWNQWYLRQFNISGADLSDLVPADLANFHNVQHLWMTDANIDSLDAGIFADMPNLKTLHLGNNNLRIDSLTPANNFLQYASGLQILGLGDNRLTQFRSSWLHPDALSTLRRLFLQRNPMSIADLDGLVGLTILYLNDTLLTELDDAIGDMDDLSTLRIRGLTQLPYSGYHSTGDPANFLANLPNSISRLVIDPNIGNPSDIEDAELDIRSKNLALAVHSRLRETNGATASNGRTVNFVTLTDPCRPVDFEAWPRDENVDPPYGDTCLGESEKSTVISSLSEFKALNEIEVYNADLTDAQVTNLIAASANVRDFDLPGYERTRSVERFALINSPRAFGEGFSISALDPFKDMDDLYFLQVNNTSINYPQASAMLRNVQEALAKTDALDTLSGVRYGLSILDLSNNPDLFRNADGNPVDGSSAYNFLQGLPSASLSNGFSLHLANTGLTFLHLKAIVNSIDSGTGLTASDRAILRTLDVSDNPNVWNVWDPTANSGEGGFVDAPAADVTAVLQAVPGLQALYIGNTGITTQAQIAAIIDGVNADADSDGAEDGRETSSAKRAQTLDISGNDLSGVTASALTTEFGKLGPRLDGATAAFKTISLADTGVDLAQVQAIATALATAQVIETISEIDLSNNPELFDGETPADLSALVAQLAKVKTVDLSNNGLTFDQLKAIVDGLDMTDGDNTNGFEGKLALRDNDELFMEEDPEDVAAVFAKLVNTGTDLVGTGITARQGAAVLNERTRGLTEQQRLTAERQFRNSNPQFSGATPLPDDISVKSGRGQLEVSFTHDPRDPDDATLSFVGFNRYEFRFRVAPANTNELWTGSGTQAWRTASVGSLDPTALTTLTRMKAFQIYGLQPETTYQIQLRAQSILSPSVATFTQGTTLNLPEINSIRPAVTELSLRAGDTVRLEVNVYGLSDIMDNKLAKSEPASNSDTDNRNLIFRWSSAGGGSFAPNDARRVLYTAPGLPGTYQVTAEAQPDGVCKAHHESDFGITDAQRADCIATFTVRVSRAQAAAETQPEPVNPAGLIPTSLVDNAGVNYAVFTPVNGGTFSDETITVTAPKGAIPDQQLLGIAATVSDVPVPEPTPGARMTLAGSFYDINGVQRNGDAPVSGFKLNAPLSACLPMPSAFRSNLANLAIVARYGDGALAPLTTTLRQTAGELTVCGAVGQVPATVAVAKLGIVEAPAETTPDPNTGEAPDTGATAPSISTATWTAALAAMLLLAAVIGMVGTRSLARTRGFVRTLHVGTHRDASAAARSGTRRRSSN